MPTPIGHSLAGLATLALGKKNSAKPTRENLEWAALLVAASVAPDLDFIHWTGEGMTLTARYHHGFTHSIGFAICVGAAVGLWARLRGSGEALRAFALVTIAYSLHVFLDLLNVDSYPANGIGLPAFWPLTGEYYIIGVMGGIDRSDPLTIRTLKTLAYELFFFGPITLAAFVLRIKMEARRRENTGALSVRGEQSG